VEFRGPFAPQLLEREDDPRGTSMVISTPCIDN